MILRYPSAVDIVVDPQCMERFMHAIKVARECSLQIKLLRNGDVLIYSRVA